MAGDTDVALSSLQRISGTLSNSAHGAENTKLGEAPKADTATGALSAAMSVLTDTLADLADACEGASAKVRDSHESFASMEHDNRAQFKPGK